MSSAKVRFQEIDLSTRVPSFPGVFGGMVVQAKKGPINEPFLVTTDTQLLEVFTPNRTVEVGFDLAYFSALAYLEKSDKLWIVRSAKDALFAGASVKRSDASTLNQALPDGFQLTDPDAYIFDGNPDVDAVIHIERFTAVADVSDSSDLQGVVINDSAGSVAFWIDVDDSGSGIPAFASAADRAVEVTSIVTDDAIGVMATKLAAAINADSEFAATADTNDIVITHTPAGARATGVDGDSFFVGGFTVDQAGVDEVDNVDEIFLIHSANQGDWGDEVGFKIITDQLIVKEADAFIIEVFRLDNQATPIETHLVSRIEGKLDGFGRNIYIETVLEGSNFIRVKDNLAVADSIQPLAQATIIFLNAGDDGTAVTDSEQILASDTLDNKDSILLTCLMDGGFVGVAYQQNLEKICNLVTGRGDCVALLSTSFADEANANFISALLTYRNDTLNLNTSFAALYSPHVSIFDKFNNRQLFISPDGFAGAAISFSAANFEIWFPPAGFKRGIIVALDLHRRFDEAQRDVLADAEINPLRFAPGKGIAIWGQKTLLSRASALQDLNVRLLLIVIEPAVEEALEDFLFELNDPSTRSLADALLVEFLSDIQGRRGVQSFQVVVDNSNNSPADIDAGRMNVDIFINPTRAIIEIPVRVVITATGLSFEDAAAAIGG